MGSGGTSRRTRSGDGGPGLYLFDDAVADGWEPFALTRPGGELRYGALLLRERIERFAGRAAEGTFSRPWLARFAEPGAPPVLAYTARPEKAPRLLMCARTVPADGARLPDPRSPTLLRVAGAVAGALVPAGAEPPPHEWLARPGPLKGWGEAELEGEMLPAAWSLVGGVAERLARDLTAMGGGRGSLPPGAHRLGRGAIRLGRDVRVEPGVLFDVREGPIHLGDGVEVRFGARLAGPLLAGAGSRLLGGCLSRVAAGPVSYLRGEVEEAVVLGYSNKAHEGFLGHSCVGRWVNLGALTTTSDLKNNYGPVRVGAADGTLETGLLKLGSLIGDHARTAIGTLLDTGTVVGSGANVFGAAPPPKWVPPFAWGTGGEGGHTRREAFLATARTVHGRRGVPFDARTEAWLSDVWEAACGPSERPG